MKVYFPPLKLLKFILTQPNFHKEIITTIDRIPIPPLSDTYPYTWRSNNVTTKAFPSSVYPYYLPHPYLENICHEYKDIYDIPHESMRPIHPLNCFL